MCSLKHSKRPSLNNFGQIASGVWVWIFLTPGNYNNSDQTRKHRVISHHLRPMAWEWGLGSQAQLCNSGKEKGDSVNEERRREREETAIRSYKKQLPFIWMNRGERLLGNSKAHCFPHFGDFHVDKIRQPKILLKEYITSHRTFQKHGR